MALEFCRLGQPDEAFKCMPASITSQRAPVETEFDPYSPMPLHYCQVTLSDPYGSGSVDQYDVDQ